MTAVALPAPLDCSPTDHPLRWAWQKLQLLVAAGLFAYIGMLIIVAIYYLLFEVDPTMTRWWHGAVSNSAIRHDIRDVGEGLLGGLLAQQIIWNHYKKSVQKRLRSKPNLLDRAEIALHIPNVKDGKPFAVGELLASPFLAILYAIPGFVVGLEIATFFHHHHVPVTANLATHHTPSLLTKTEQTWTLNWDKKLIGYFAAFFFGRRPVRGVFDDVQLLFAERRVLNNQPVRWYHLPNFKARYNDVRLNVERYRIGKQSVWIKRAVIGVIPIAFGLAVFGWYVLSYIA